MDMSLPVPFFSEYQSTCGSSISLLKTFFVPLGLHYQRNKIFEMGLTKCRIWEHVDCIDHRGTV